MIFLKNKFQGTVISAMLGVMVMAKADFINGGFSFPLDGSWSTKGSIALAGQVGVMTDDTQVSIIWQEVPIEPNDYLLRFDFLVATSSVVQPGHFNDTLFGSVYYHPKDDSVFNPEIPDGFSKVTPLFDADASGLVLYGGAVTPSDKGEGWKTFTATITVDGDNPVLVMDLRDLNGVVGDSTIALDNFTLTSTAVPEPSSFALLGGLATLSIILRRSNRRA